MSEAYSCWCLNTQPIRVVASATHQKPSLTAIVCAIIPQIIPPFVSFTVYRWDVNIRSRSTIIGGVGGSGFLLIQWTRLSDYNSAGIAVWLIAIVVSVLDYASSQIRKEFV
jgi:phosphonate transport system permease protein